MIVSQLFFILIAKVKWKRPRKSREKRTETKNEPTWWPHIRTWRQVTIVIGTAVLPGRCSDGITLLHGAVMDREIKTLNLFRDLNNFNPYFGWIAISGPSNNEHNRDALCCIEQWMYHVNRCIFCMFWIVIQIIFLCENWVSNRPDHLFSW